MVGWVGLHWNLVSIKCMVFAGGTELRGIGGGAGGGGGLDAKATAELVATCTAAATAAMLKVASSEVSDTFLFPSSL